jgi:Pyridoxamine 5'-phosphate oxidase
MPDQKGRNLDQRKADVLAALNKHADLWLATADKAGRPHLIAISAWWDGDKVIVATTAASRTARNLEATRTARLAVGSPDDVIVIDATLSGSPTPVQTAPGMAKGFAAAVGWDPREISDDWAYLTLVPSRIQAYRGYDELPGREVMRDGRWLA